MIPVTKPFLPPLEEYEALVKQIWKREWLTNNGPLVNELELKLKQYLNLPHLLYVSNGTIALQLAIKALELKGEIITTPFSYVATTSSIVWEGCKPVFVDINPHDLNIDPSKIEEAISPNTSAILATHVYGNPCDVEAIQRIADKYNLKVIYDAAHCFGTKYKGVSIFKFGDVSTTSFHATKLYHTIEGGAVFSQNPETLRKLAYMRNFGHNGPESFEGVGINGKNSEFHAAMGLINLKYIEDILQKRKLVSSWYDDYLSQPAEVSKPTILPNTDFNYAYYPLVFENEQILLKVLQGLNRSEIFPRRYFYPSLTNLPYIQTADQLISNDISTRVLCLPLYHTMEKEEAALISRIIIRNLKY